MKTILITGTDTDVGKTVLTTALAAYWRIYRDEQSLGLMKLIQTGLGDRQLYQQLFGDHGGMEIVAPLCFDLPVAPPIAAEREGREIKLEIVWEALTNLQRKSDFVIVEALGGLGSPVTRELTVADLAGDWRLETILVVPVKLGAIAQAMANVTLARHCGVNLRGIVLSCVSLNSEQRLTDWTPIELIQSLTNVPVLGILPYLVDPIDVNNLAKVASNLDLERLLF